MVTLVSIREIQGFCSGRRYSQLPRLSRPKQFTLRLGKWGLKHVPCLFSMGSSLVLFVLRARCGASLYLCPADCFQDILLEQAGNSHWNKLAFLHISSDISAPWAHESNPLDVNAAKHARNSRKVQEDKLTWLCVVCGLLAMLRNRKWLFWDLPISVRKSTNIALEVLIMQCLLIEKTRRWNAD